VETAFDFPELAGAEDLDLLCRADRLSGRFQRTLP
jgi:hypothetical protein